MSEQTESLLKILNIGDSGKKKANVHVPQFQYRRSAQRANYRMRLNSVPVESSISALGQTCRIQLPSYTNLCGEIYLKLKFSELSVGTWNPRVAASAVSRMVLRHSDIAYEVEDPAAVFAYCLSKMRNKEEKELRKELFGTATPSGDEQNCLVTLLHPWCYFFQPEFAGDGPARHGRRNALFPAHLLKENCIWEITFAPVANLCSSNANGAAMSNVELVWEELVCSAKDRAEFERLIPTKVCAPDFTIMQVALAADTKTRFDISAITSRAPSHCIALFLQQSGEADPFGFEEDFKEAEIICDGRVVVSTKDQNSAERKLRDILEGRPRRTAPNVPVVSFGQGSHTLAHAHPSISNTAVNQMDIDITMENACSGSIMAVHEREFSVERGTIVNQNVY